MKLDLGKWAHLCASGPFAAPPVPAFAGISGGRTSGMMGALLHPSTVRVFENTGMEHPKTYEFVERLSDAYQEMGAGPIVWLEWRPPAVKGDPPKRFGFEIVTAQTAYKGPDLIVGALVALAEYRATKGLPPVEPWARQRLCTAYLKHRVQRAWIERSGVDAYDSIVGLRADEPDRVSRIRANATAARSYSCPLSAAGITVCDVGAFWEAQPFDLGLEPYQGNCTGCFLKDESDLSRALGEPETRADDWVEIQRRWPGFGGRDKPSYAQLLSERPMRLAIEAAIKRGGYVENDGSMNPRRFRLVTIQESKRIKGERAGFSCACEASIAMSDEDDDQLDLWGDAA